MLKLPVAFPAMLPSLFECGNVMAPDRSHRLRPSEPGGFDRFQNERRRMDDPRPFRTSTPFAEPSAGRSGRLGADGKERLWNVNENPDG